MLPSRASDGLSETVAPPHAEALDTVPGLPLDYAQVDRNSDNVLERLRYMTDVFRDMRTFKLHPPEVSSAPLMMSSWFRDLLHEGCLSTLQSLDRTGYLELKSCLSKISIKCWQWLSTATSRCGLSRDISAQQAFKHDVLSFSKATLC